MKNFERAIKMELDGETYYREQAKLNKDNSLNTVFLLLAEDERNHAKILESKFNKLSFQLDDNNILLESKNVFKGIRDFKSEIKKNPSQLDVYKLALVKEKESIDLYKKSLSEATNHEEKELFEYLVKQETDHFQIVEELILLLSRPDDWVESAEFGIREEY